MYRWLCVVVAVGLMSSAAEAQEEKVKPRFGDFEIGMTRSEVYEAFRKLEGEGNFITPIRYGGAVRFLPDRDPYKGMQGFLFRFTDRSGTPGSIADLKEGNQDARLSEMTIGIAPTGNEADHEAFFAVVRGMYGDPDSEKKGQHTLTIRMADGEMTIIALRSAEWNMEGGKIIAYLQHHSRGGRPELMFNFPDLRDASGQVDGWDEIRKDLKLPAVVLKRWSIEAPKEGSGIVFRSSDNRYAPVHVAKEERIWKTLEDVERNRIRLAPGSAVEKFQRVRAGSVPALWHYTRIRPGVLRENPGMREYLDGDVTEAVYIQVSGGVLVFSISYWFDDAGDEKRRGLWSIVRSWGK